MKQQPISPQKGNAPPLKNRRWIPGRLATLWSNWPNREQLAIGLILLAFMVLATAASVINPLHEATDELRHYRFVRQVAVNRMLPVQGQMGCSAQGHHPPLYYALAALATTTIDTGRPLCYAPPDNPFWAYRSWDVGVDNKNQYLHGADEAWPWHGEALAAHIARLVNVLIGTGVVYLTWLIGKAIWPQRPLLALGGTAFVAFNPMFVYMSGAINNDVIAAFSGAVVTLACVHLLQNDKGLSRRWGVVFGLLYGLALLSKFNLAMIGILVATAVTWVAWRKKQWRLWLEVGLIAAVMTALIAGWWFVRNQMLYGEPTGVQRLTELWGVRNPAESFDIAIYELPYAWTSLWGRFGYGQIPLPGIYYALLGGAAIIAFAGLMLPLNRLRIPVSDPRPSLSIRFLLLNVLLFFAVLFSYLLISPAGPMGRFFFPALPSLGVVLFYGLSKWDAVIGRRQAKPTLGLTVLGHSAMLLLTLIALFGYLRPAYGRPQPFGLETAVPNPVAVRFDSFVTLRGYEVHQTEVQPGDPIDIDLYWEVNGQPPGNYLLFVHLIDNVGTMVTQRDTHPGLGNFPSSLWQPGDRFVESIRVYLPETAYAPETVDLSIGLYAPGPDGYRLGISQPDGSPGGDALVLKQVALETPVSGYPNPQDWNFNGLFQLTGYEFNQRLLAPGDILEVALYWESLSDVTPNEYAARVQLVDGQGKIYSASDEPLLARGRIVQRIPLTLPADIPLQPYNIHVMLVDAITQVPQNIIAEDGHWLDNRLSLAGVNMQP